jgi:hypothetical protein
MAKGAMWAAIFLSGVVGVGAAAIVLSKES